MFHGDDEQLLATTEQMLVHVDMNAGRSAAILPEVRAALDAIARRALHPSAGRHAGHLVAVATVSTDEPGVDTLDFALSDEQQMIVDTVRSFTERELFPHEEQVEKLGEVPPELVQQIKKRSIDAGLYAANMPAELGGGGLDTFGVTLVDREFGAASYALALHRRPTQSTSCAPAPATRSTSTCADDHAANVSTAWP